MGQSCLNITVFDAAIERMIRLYKNGDRVIVSFSGGKDSGICLEICRIAAAETNRLPVEVAMRDEEIMVPGTFEYCERVAAEPDIEFHWMIANQPVVNMFNRKNPYFWVFDSALKPEDWVRIPPEIAYIIPEKHIQGMVTPDRFPPAKGKDLISVIGLRVQESPTRRMAVHKSKGFLTKGNSYGVRYARPIYDWKDGDVWKAIRDNSWDYNSAYDVMNRLGVSCNDLRIAPPTQVAAELDKLSLFASAWPKWFDKVCKRLPGVRTASMFKRFAVEASRKYGESWQDCFNRECVENAPNWIGERALKVANHCVARYRSHSNDPFPDVASCPRCGRLNSWRTVVKAMYMGDPFSLKQSVIAPVEPEFFRPGSGTWGGGKPTF